MAHDHYKKDVRHLDTLDVYRVLSLFNVTDPCIQHAVKKLLVTGGRGGSKGFDHDIQDAIDSLERLKQMRAEDVRPDLRAKAEALWELTVTPYPNGLLRTDGVVTRVPEQ